MRFRLKAGFIFKAALQIAGQIHTTGIKAQASLELGRLYQAKKRNDLAVPPIKESMALFEQLGANGHLRRVQAALDAVEKSASAM